MVEQSFLLTICHMNAVLRIIAVDVIDDNDDGQIRSKAVAVRCFLPIIK